jgi:hypothetical protein
LVQRKAPPFVRKARSGAFTIGHGSVTASIKTPA